MIRRVSRGRAGITLTEILISIMIMGVGLVSLATLFPLGLLRLRAASRHTRSAFLSESAVAEVGTRNLLARSSFFAPKVPDTWYRPTVAANTFGDPYIAAAFDPWIQDTPLPRSGNLSTRGVYRGWGGYGSPLDFTPTDDIPDQPYLPGPGLPVAYDPLWRAVTNIYPDPDDAAQYRFAASGPPSIRSDPNGGSAPADQPSAHGLQRITNFPPALATSVPGVFVSPDDVVFQSADGAQGPGSASPIVPEMTGGVMVNDWRYTWMFTGRRSDATNTTIYEGDIVVFDGRPLAVDGGSVVGERVVEAVFGYSKNVLPSAGARGYGAAADRVVLLRWLATEPDPDMKVGSWIADVTYERFDERDTARKTSATGVVGLVAYPGQRCHWYQVAKKTPAQPAIRFNGDATGVLYRSMTVLVNSPLRARTLLDNSSVALKGHPYHVNVALVSPYVINVFPKTFYAH